MEYLLKLLGHITWESILFSFLRIVLILCIGWVALVAVRIALRRLETALVERTRSEGELLGEATKRVETLARLIRQAAIVVIWILIILMIMREIGIEIGPILASAGIAGLAIGFGAQNLVRDLITGFFMILENQVRVGDVAVVNGTGGLVERINLRTIVLRDGAGTVHVFPNGTINTLANQTRDWSAYLFNIAVAYKEDVDRVMEIMRRIGGEMRNGGDLAPFIIADIEIFGVDQYAESGVVIAGRIRTIPSKQADVGRAFLKRLKNEFERAGIEMALPQRKLYVGGMEMPLDVRLMGLDAQAAARRAGDDRGPDDAAPRTPQETRRGSPE